MIVLIVVLIVLFRQRRTGKLEQPPAILTWLGFSVLALFVVGVAGGSFLLALVLYSVPLLSGLIILAIAKSKVQVPTQA